jgi:hypothetical protein
MSQGITSIQKDSLSPLVKQAKLEPSSHHYKMEKPSLESPEAYQKKVDVLPSAIIFAHMIDNMQRYAQSTAEPAQLRHAQVGKKIQKVSEDIKQVEHNILDTKKNIETWESRHRIANYLLNGVTTLTGVGLVAAGDLWTGGSLIVSGLGGAASSLMDSFGFNSTLTSAISFVSGLVGVVGGIGSAAYQLYNYGPMAFLSKLTDNKVSGCLQLAGSLASVVASGISGYADIEKQNNLSTLSEYDSMHTQKTTERQLLEPKLSSATTSHQGAAKNIAKACRTIVHAQTRFTRDAMRMLTADFPA